MSEAKPYTRAELEDAEVFGWLDSETATRLLATIDRMAELERNWHASNRAIAELEAKLAEATEGECMRAVERDQARAEIERLRGLPHFEFPFKHAASGYFLEQDSPDDRPAVTYRGDEVVQEIRDRLRDLVDNVPMVVCPHGRPATMLVPLVGRRCHRCVGLGEKP